MRVSMCGRSGVCVWASRVVFLLWSFTVQWCREGGILVIVWVSGEFVWAQEHGACERVRGGVAIESPECVMRNVDAKREKEREGERGPATYDNPSPTFAS